MSRTPEDDSQYARLTEICDLTSRLQATTGSSESVNRLVALYGQQLADCEDRVLRIAGRLCLEYGQRELWGQIYQETLDDDGLPPGDEMAFLISRPLDAEWSR